MPDFHDTDERVPSIPLLESFRDAGAESVIPPPVEWIAATAHRRGRRRAVATSVAAGVAVVAMAVTAFTVTGGPGQPVHPADPVRPTVAPATPASPSATTATTTPLPPPLPTSTASPRPTSTPSKAPASFDPRRVNWNRATIVLPGDPADSDCPTGRVTLRDGEAVAGGQRFAVVGEPLVYGDLTRDGVQDVVLNVGCRLAEGLSGDGSGNLLVVTQRDGVLVGLGHVGPVGQNYRAAKVRGGLLVATIEQRYGNNVVQERSYRWNGRRFVQVAGPTTFPIAR